MNRRKALMTGGLMLAGIVSPAVLRASAPIVEINMRSDVDGTRVWFDPIGLLVQPGTTIRWINRENVHTATAYHPDNDNHSLRIPPGSKPWNSDYLINPGDQFEIRLSVPGVYDYYCIPHEEAGMVGRIIVDSPSGPGSLPFDYFKSSHPDWESIPILAQQNFPSIKKILSLGTERTHN